jgi:DNA primase
MSVVDDVKGRIDIVDLVGSYVPLQKAGKNFKAPCPFHTERTPSFFVFPERGTWRCFGACATGGDGFSFVQRVENLTFSEALRRLAERTGVVIEDRRVKDDRQEREKERLYSVLQAAADYFHRILAFSPAGEEARRYLAGRGVAAETMSDFQLGLGPNGWEVLKRHLADMGYTEQEMLTAGLLVQREGDRAGTYDRFRSRIIFPIRDLQGRTIGFGARSMDGSQPKYLNSPQTPLFDKSGVLYALDKAKDAIKQEGLVVLVEGYMDALQAHQSGFRNVVGVMGTSLTERQVAQVRRYTRRFALALDPDAAGEEATRRSLEGAWRLFQREVVRVAGSPAVAVRPELPDLRLISLPPGQDPDEVIRNDPDDWRHRVESAAPILDYLISWEASRSQVATPEGKLEVVDRVFPLISAMDNPFEQETAFRKLAQALGVDERTLEAAVGRPASRRRRATARPVREQSAAVLTTPAGDPLEEHLLGLVLVYGEEVWRAWDELRLPAVPAECFWNPENAELWRVLTTGDPVEEAEALLSASAERLRSALSGKPLNGRNLARALGDLVRRLLERQIKMQEEEAALAVAAVGEDLEGAQWALGEDVRKQFIERVARLRALERSRWGRAVKGA